MSNPRGRQPERVEYMRRFQLRRYGLTTDQYEALEAESGGLCSICRRPESATRNGKVRNLCIDHDHSCCPGTPACGQCVRGLLCNGCNRGIGYFNDRADLFLAALRYLGKDRPWPPLIHSTPISSAVMSWSPSSTRAA